MAPGALDISSLELITPHVTEQLQAFNQLVVDHLRNYKPEIARIDGALTGLGVADEALGRRVDNLQSDVAHHYDQAVSNHASLDERVTMVEQLLAALPAWKEDLLGRIDALTRETRAKHEATGVRVQALEATVDRNEQGTRERLDTLTTVAKTASDARAQQQERIDTMDRELKQGQHDFALFRGTTNAELKRQADVQAAAAAKASELGASYGLLRLDVDRQREAQALAARQIEGLAKTVDSLVQVTQAYDQQTALMKKSVAATDEALQALLERLAASEASVAGRLGALEAHRNTIFEWRDATVTRLQRMDQERASVQERIQVVDQKVDAGPPGLWRVAAQVQVHEEELAAAKTALTEAQHHGADLARRLDDAMSALSHHKDMVAQLGEEAQRMGERMTSEATRAQQYCDDRVEPLARRYEVEALRRSLEQGLGELRTAMEGSGERLKFELLHDEVPQVASVREYMALVEGRCGQLAESVLALREDLRGQQERGAAMAAVAREMRSQLDGLLGTTQSDVARVRNTLQSLHEEYEAMTSKARKAGILTAAQVEALVDLKLNSASIDAHIGRKLIALGVAQQKGEGPQGPQGHGLAALGSATTSTANLVLSPSPSGRPTSAVLSAATAALRAQQAGGGSAHGSRRFLLRAASEEQQQQNDGEQSAASLPQQSGLSPAAFGGGAEGAAAAAAYAAAAAGGGGACALDPDMGLRLVSVEAQVAQLGEAMRGLGAAVAAAPEAAALRSQVAALSAAVAHLQSCQGVMGEAGEEAVRRHVHATLLPEVQDRQASDARRLMAYVAEQLGGAARASELRTLQRAMEQVRQQVAQQQGQGQGGASAAQVVVARGLMDARLGSLEQQVEALAGQLGLPLQPTDAPAMKEGQEDARDQSGGGPVLSSLPQLLQRVADLEARTAALAAGQQAAEASAAAAAGAVRISLEQQQQDGAGGASPGDAGGAEGLRLLGTQAVQGLVAAAVSELKGRVRQVEVELPLMARTYELDALRRLLMQLQQQQQQAVAAGISAGAARGAGAPPAASAPPQHQQLVVAAAAGAGRRLDSLELALTTMDERGKALDARWAALEARWGGVLADARDALPRLQAAVTALARDVARLLAGAAAAPLDGAGGGAFSFEGQLALQQRQALLAAGGGSQHQRWLPPSADTDGGGDAGQLVTRGSPAVLPAGLPNAMAYMAEFANMELSGLAHDLTHAAHEELKRTRDGPLPDGTQDGLPTPAALAAREAALRRLRAQPREVAAHVELLEAVKLHLDRLARRAASSTTDHLVLLAAMMGMRVKLLEDAQAGYREQMGTALRSLERAFQTLASLQEGLASKGSAAAVSQLAAMVRDVSQGLMEVAAQARDGGVGVTGAKRAVGSAEPDTWRAMSFDQQQQPPGTPSWQDGSPGSPPRMASPTPMVRPSSPLRLAAPGVMTHQARQQAAAVRSGGSKAQQQQQGSGPGSPAGPHLAWPSAASASGSPQPQSPMAGGSGNPGAAGASGSNGAGLPYMAGSFLPSTNANPPPSFMKEKRDLVAEYERAMAATWGDVGQQGAGPGAGLAQQPGDAAGVPAPVSPSGRAGPPAQGARAWSARRGSGGQTAVGSGGASSGAFSAAGGAAAVLSGGGGYGPGRPGMGLVGRQASMSAGPGAGGPGGSHLPFLAVGGSRPATASSRSALNLGASRSMSAAAPPAALQGGGGGAGGGQ